MDKQQAGRIVVGITGASGSIYGIRLVHALLESGCEVSLILTAAGRRVLQYELGLDWIAGSSNETLLLQKHFSSTAIVCLDIDDIGAAIASGSAAPQAVVIAPCSMGTAGRIAAGLSGNLLERAADVMLKERRPLLLVPRETPLSVIHLENLLRLANAGAIVLPAMPGFYHKPDSVDALTDFVVGKILDQLNISHRLFNPWDGK